VKNYESRITNLRKDSKRKTAGITEDQKKKEADRRATERTELADKIVAVFEGVFRKAFNRILVLI
jgi:hypothetical protein